MSQESKQELWVGRLADYAASGLSQKQWCAQHDVALHQFAYWRQRLNGTGPGNETSKAGPAAWCAVQLLPKDNQPKANHSGVTVRVGGASIVVEPGFDANLLRAVVEALVQGSLTNGGA